MKKKPASQSAFFNPRVLISFALLIGTLLLVFQTRAPGIAQENATTLQLSSDSENVPAHELLTAEQAAAGMVSSNSFSATDPLQGSCNLIVLPSDGSTSGNARAPSTRFAFSRSVYLITAAELAANGFAPGQQPTSIGWRFSTAPGGAGGSAPLTILLENTTDTTNTKSTTWATAISTMTTVHSAVTALPSVIGAYDIPFSGGSPFTYTGGGIYVAHDWGQYTGTLSTAAVFACNVALVNGLLGANSNAATVVASNFRPETRLNSFLQNDRSVDLVYSYGEVPLGLIPPQVIGSVVSNRGVTAGSNVPATLNVTGADTFTNMQNIASLTSCGGQSIVSFAGFTPGALGNDNIAVSVPADDFAPNNTRNRTMAVTPLSYSYKHPGSTANGGVGVAGATAALVAKFTTTAANSVVDVKLEFNAASATTYRVVIHADNGSGLPATAPIYIDAADRTVAAAGPVTITLPAPVAVGPGNFFVGINQTNTTNAALSFDTENPIRTGSFFLAIPTGTAFFDAAPGNNFKLNIGINLQTGGTSPTPTPSASPSATAAPTATATATASATASPTATASATASATPSATASPSASAGTPTPSPTCAPALTEGFESVPAIFGAGWAQDNNSEPLGASTWTQGAPGSGLGAAQGGTTNSFAVCNFNSTTGAGTISNWLLTPVLTLQDGATLTFWTRTAPGSTFPDRLQVRMSTAGASVNVGTTSTDVGDFTALLVDINPTLASGGYPNAAWTQFTATVTGVPTQTTGRMAFRYFVTNGGPDGANSNIVGLDTVDYNGPCGATPTPGTPSPSPSATASASATATIAPTATPSATGTPPGGTATPSATATPPGGTATPSATASPSASGTPGASPSPAQAINFSTRMFVQTGDRVGIGGFIITGTVPKHVLLRAIGPSLTQNGIVDPLADPVIELHGPGSFATITNNNWRDTQETAIESTGIPPTNDFEAAIDATLPPGNYTAVVRGNNNTTGTALVEVYDLDAVADSRLSNISTRAFVGTGDDVVIAGFILGNNSGDDQVIVRGLGPSLAGLGVSSVLANPTLELRDNNGSLLTSNNDWQDNAAQAAIIAAAGLAPSNDLEAAIAETLPPGLYTALLAGVNKTAGNGLVEVYDLGDGSGVPPPPSPTPGGSPAPSPTPGGSPSPSATPGGTPGPSPTPISSPTPTPAASPSPPSGPCVENFDGVTAPALPAGWTATNAEGPAPFWVTSVSQPFSPANCAFVPDAGLITDKRLDSRPIVVGSGAVLSFKNNYNTEYDPPPAETFWDGWVLEVSTDDGATYRDFTDPLVGASCVSGCYTGVITGIANNPLSDRLAWSGNSGGYIDTVINLGSILNGQTIRLRFRIGTDEKLAAPGVRVDDISITNASCP